MFGCRLDGLDPMIAWAMGAATGHTAMALWKDGELFVCESNAKVKYCRSDVIEYTLQFVHIFYSLF